MLLNNLLYLLSIDEQPLKLIEQYGIMAVAVVVLSIAVVRLFKIIIKRYQEQENRISKLQDIMSNMAEAQNQQPIDNESLEKRARLSDNINNILFNMLSEYEADKVSIYEFHNGGKSYYGLNFNKASCTYNASRIPSQRIKEYQNIPISTNLIWNTMVLTKDPFYVKNVEQLKDVDHGLYFMLKASDIKSYYANLLMDLSGNPLGIIAIEYANKVQNLSKSELEDFRSKTYTISGMILKELQ